MQTLLLVDGNALMHRAYYALPPFKAQDGTPTNAIYGFFTMLHKAITDFNPQYVAVCFDTPKPTFRQEIYKEYQIQRPKMDNDLSQQFPLVKELLDKAGLFHEEKEGFEADDIIGTIVHHVKQDKNMKILILTGDKDIMQLIDENVFTVNPQIGFSKTKIYNRQEVLSKFGIQPEQIADFKALVGDPSDNYPGVKGIGPKNAVILLQKFETIDNLLKHLEEVAGKMKPILKANKKEIALSKKLSQIVANAPIKFKLEQSQFDGFKRELREGLLALNITSLTARFFPANKSKLAEKTKKQTKQTKTEADAQIGLF